MTNKLRTALRAAQTSMGNCQHKHHFNAMVMVERALADHAQAEPPQTLRDAAENLLIAIGMGWDIEGCVENLRAALAQSDAEPICKICGGSGYTRHLGRDNSEEVENCSCRQQSDTEL